MLGVRRQHYCTHELSSPAAVDVRSRTAGQRRKAWANAPPPKRQRSGMSRSDILAVARAGADGAWKARLVGASISMPLLRSYRDPVAILLLLGQSPDR